MRNKNVTGERTSSVVIIEYSSVNYQESCDVICLMCFGIGRNRMKHIVSESRFTNRFEWPWDRRAVEADWRSSASCAIQYFAGLLVLEPFHSKRQQLGGSGLMHRQLGERSARVGWVNVRHRRNCLCLLFSALFVVVRQIHHLHAWDAFFGEGTWNRHTLRVPVTCNRLTTKILVEINRLMSRFLSRFKIYQKTPFQHGAAPGVHGFSWDSRCVVWPDF